MSGLVDPEILDKTDVFRRVRARSFASVHGVSVVNLWSVLGRCARPHVLAAVTIRVYWAERLRRSLCAAAR
jgi:hypothetical protein